MEFSMLVDFIQASILFVLAAKNTNSTIYITLERSSIKYFTFLQVPLFAFPLPSSFEDWATNSLIPLVHKV
jgi:hypothetical protein